MVFYRRFNGQRSAKNGTIRVFHCKLLRKSSNLLRIKPQILRLQLNLAKLKHNSALNAWIGVPLLILWSRALILLNAWDLF